MAKEHLFLGIESVDMNILLNLFFLIIFPSEFEDKQNQKIYSKIIDYEKTNKTFELLLEMVKKFMSLILNK